MADPIQMIDVDQRLLEVSNVLAAYSMGDFDSRAELSSQYDNLDTIISGINMLGEELQERTISRDFMSSVFRAVKDFLITLDDEGRITDFNEAVPQALHVKESELKGAPVADFFEFDDRHLEALDGLRAAYRQGADGDLTASFETTYTYQNGQRRFVDCSLSLMTNGRGVLEGYLLAARDTTEKKTANQVFMRAMVEAVEKERSRVANDLHDSIGQELSGLKMILEHLLKQACEGGRVEEDERSMVLEIIDRSIRGLRETCYDLMPSSLESKGLRVALIELRKRLPAGLTMDILIEPFMDEVPKTIQVDLFRVAQEFISNSIKHAKAKHLECFITEEEGQCHMHLADDGIGFDQDHIQRKGRGLYTMQSRVETMNGDLEFRTAPGQGTQIDIYFNLNTYEEYSSPDRR